MTAFQPIGFRCPQCGAARPNPEARHPPGEFRAIINSFDEKLCESCLADGNRTSARAMWFRDAAADLLLRADALIDRPSADRLVAAERALAETAARFTEMLSESQPDPPPSTPRLVA